MAAAALEARGICKLQPGLKLWAESCSPTGQIRSFPAPSVSFLFVIGHLSFVILLHDTSLSLLG
jgi:hypothetical protein